MSISTKSSIPVLPVLLENGQACCPPLLGAVIEDAEAAAAAGGFKALSDPARVRILSLLSASANEESCVCELQEHLDLSQPTVSHHLKVLLTAGLIDRERRGSWAYYRVNRDALGALAQILGD